MKKYILVLLVFSFTSMSYAQEYDFLDDELVRIPMTAFEGPIKLTAPAFLYDGTAINSKDLSDYMFKPELKISFFGVKEGTWKLKAIVFEKEEDPQRIEQKRRQYNRRNSEDPLLNKPSPEIETVDLSGEALKLSDFKGKLVVLNFWFIGCKPCIMEMPELNELVEEYKAEDIVFLAVALDNALSIKEFLTKEKFDYRIIPEGRSIANDYDVYAYPTHLVIDTEGKVIFSQTGYSSNLKRALKKQIKELLK